MRLDFSLLIESHHISYRLPQQLQIIISIIAPEYPYSGDILHQENIGWNLRDLTTGKPDDEKSAFPGYTVINKIGTINRLQFGHLNWAIYNGIKLGRIMKHRMMVTCT